MSTFYLQSRSHKNLDGSLVPNFSNWIASEHARKFSSRCLMDLSGPKQRLLRGFSVTGMGFIQSLFVTSTSKWHLSAI